MELCKPHIKHNSFIFWDCVNQSWYISYHFLIVGFKFMATECFTMALIVGSVDALEPG